MRDCPACRVPLHGYEEVCPSCGTKQVPVRSAKAFGDWQPERPKVNMIPFLVVGLCFLVFFVFTLQGSWVWGVLTGANKPPADPLASMTYLQARDAIDTQLNAGLSQAGAKHS